MPTSLGHELENGTARSSCAGYYLDPFIGSNHRKGIERLGLSPVLDKFNIARIKSRSGCKEEEGGYG
jgi:hypothetical protein